MLEGVGGWYPCQPESCLLLACRMRGPQPHQPEHWRKKDSYVPKAEGSSSRTLQYRAPDSPAVQGTRILNSFPSQKSINERARRRLAAEERDEVWLVLCAIFGGHLVWGKVRGRLSSQLLWSAATVPGSYSISGVVPVPRAGRQSAVVPSEMLPGCIY